MNYRVQEEGKTGGAEFATSDQAIAAAAAWRIATDVRCEIFFRFYNTEAGCTEWQHSSVYTNEADARFAELDSVLDDCTQQRLGF